MRNWLRKAGRGMRWLVRFRHRQLWHKHLVVTMHQYHEITAVSEEEAERLATLDPSTRAELGRALSRSRLHLLLRIRRRTALAIAIFKRVLLLAVLAAALGVARHAHEHPGWLATVLNGPGDQQTQPTQWPGPPPGGWGEYLLKGCAFLAGTLGSWIPLSLLTGLPRLRRWRTTPPRRHRPASIATRLSDLAFKGEVIPFYAGTGILAAVIALTLAPGQYGRYYAMGLGGGVAAAIFFGLIGIVFAVIIRAGMVAADRESKLRPFDELLHECVPLLAQAIEFQPIWDRPDVGRFLINRFEDVARTAERIVRIERRVPLTELQLRTQVRADSLRLAAVFRLHKTAMAEARSPSEYTKILNSLASGLTAMMREDWSTLLANAPEQVRAHPALTAWASTRLAPALVLGALAAVLPEFAPFQSSAELLRISLGLYAVVTAIPRQDSTIDLVGNLIGKYAK